MKIKRNQILVTSNSIPAEKENTLEHCLSHIFYKFASQAELFSIWPRRKTLLVKHFCLRQAKVFLKFVKNIFKDCQAMFVTQNHLESTAANQC